MKTKDIVVKLDKEAGKQFATCIEVIPDSLLHIAARRLEKLDELCAFLVKLYGLTEKDPNEEKRFAKKISATDGSQLIVTELKFEYVKQVQEHVARLLAKEVGVKLPPFTK